MIKNKIDAARIIRASRICIRREKVFECKSRKLIEGVQEIKSTKMTKMTSSNDEASGKKRRANRTYKRRMKYCTQSKEFHGNVSDEESIHLKVFGSEGTNKCLSIFQQSNKG